MSLIIFICFIMKWKSLFSIQSFHDFKLTTFVKPSLMHVFRSWELQRNICGMKAGCRGKHDNFRQGLSLEDRHFKV